jgi:hypothetical protein
LEIQNGKFDNMTWISVKDRLPGKAWIRCIVCNDLIPIDVFLCTYQGDGIFRIDRRLTGLVNNVPVAATHWIEIPEIPLKT